MITVTELRPEDRALGEAVLTYLMVNEPLHCLQLGSLMPFLQGRSSSRWWVARDGAAIAGVASHTPPFNVILSAMPEEAVAALADVVPAAIPDLPGVIGPREPVEAFLGHVGRPSEVAMEQGIYACTAVTFPEGVSGSARFANEIDVPWIAAWQRQFQVDVGEPLPAGLDLEETIRGKLARGGYVIWLDEGGTPVSLAGFGNPTPNGIRIGPVYTPAEHRGHGYGTMVSAAVTQHLLDSGRRIVFLFTDLAYPVSNHVYRKIGYEQVAEFINTRFTD